MTWRVWGENLFCSLVIRHLSLCCVTTVYHSSLSYIATTRYVTSSLYIVERTVFEGPICKESWFLRLIPALIVMFWGCRTAKPPHPDKLGMRMKKMAVHSATTVASLGYIFYMWCDSTVHLVKFRRKNHLDRFRKDCDFAYLVLLTQMQLVSKVSSKMNASYELFRSKVWCFPAPNQSTVWKR